MSDVLSHTSEYVEGAQADQMLRFRNRLVRAATGLGPPDVCVLYKRYHSAMVPQFLRKAQAVGYSHWVMGIDNSRAASVCSYFQKVMAQQQDAAWFSRGTHEIVRGLYCTYDAFSGLDVRVEFALDSGRPSVEEYAVDSQQERFPTTARLWRGAFVSNGLRVLVIPATYVPCMHAEDVPLTELEETFFTWTAEFMLEECQVTRGLPHELATNDKRDVEVVQLVMARYLFSQGRTQDVIRFFTPLLHARPVVAIPLGVAYKQIGTVPDAVLKVLRALQDDPLSADLLLSQADLLLEIDKVGLACEAARLASEQEPLRAECWVMLARCYFAMQDYEGVLLALNSLPPKKVRSREDALEELINLPSHIPAKEVTQAPERATYENRHEWAYYDMECEHEELYPDIYGVEVDELDHTQEHEVKDPTLPHLRAATLEGPMLDAYKIVVDMAIRKGWRGLVKLCNALFFLDGDSANESIPEKYDRERRHAAAEIKAMSGSGSSSAGADAGAGAAVAVAAAPGGPDGNVDAVPFASKRLSSPSLALLLESLYDDMSLLHAWHEEMREERRKRRQRRKAREGALRRVEVEVDVDEQVEEEEEAEVPVDPQQVSALRRTVPRTQQQQQQQQKQQQQQQPQRVPESSSTASLDAGDEDIDDINVEMTMMTGKRNVPAAVQAETETVTATEQNDADDEEHKDEEEDDDDDDDDDEESEDDDDDDDDDDEGESDDDDESTSDEELDGEDDGDDDLDAAEERHKKQRQFIKGEPRLWDRAVKRSMCAWIAYAEMAVRLKRASDAETAYRKCLRMGKSRRAWRGLLELYTENGYLESALVAAHKLVRFDRLRFPERNVGPSCVRKAVFKLVGTFGLKAVQEKHIALGAPDGCKGFLSLVFNQAANWRVAGFDR